MIRSVSSFFSRAETMMRPLAHTVIRVAIQAIYIFGVILMAAVAIPIHFHWIALPIVALSSTLFAAHFYAGSG